VTPLWLQEELYQAWQVEVPVKCHHGKLYVRISAHIYNKLEDYQELVTAVSGIEKARQRQAAAD
jgi:selenocysteine lyase/cysteine desulfurase